MASLRLPLFLRPRCSSFFALLPWPSRQSKDGGHLLPILSFLGHFHFIELQSMCLACREGEYHNRWWSPLLAQVGSGLALCVPWKAMKVSYLSSVKLLCFFFFRWRVCGEEKFCDSLFLNKSSTLLMVAVCKLAYSNLHTRMPESHLFKSCFFSNYRNPREMRLLFQCYLGQGVFFLNHVAFTILWNI